MNYFIRVLISLMFVFISFSCKKGADNFTVYDNGNTIIPNTTKIISDNDFKSSLISLDSTNYSLIFSSTRMPDNINVGDIIISGVGDGLLRKVTKISNSSDQVILQTDRASFAESFQKADLKFSSNETTKSANLNGLEIEYIHKGIKLDTLHKGSVSINELLKNISFDLTLDGDGNEETLDDQVQLNGTFSFSQNYDGEIKIDNNNLKKLSLDYSLQEQLELSASCPLAQVKLEKEIKYLKIKYPLIYCTIGPAPVIVRPILTLYFGVSFDVSSSVATSVSQSFTLNTGVTWEAGSWTKSANIEKSFNFQPPQITAEATCKAYIRPELEMKFYGSIAPKLSIPVYDKLSVDVLGNPWWTLTSGLKGDIGVSVGIFDKQLIDYSTNLFDISFPITKASGPFPSKPVANFSVSPTTISAGETVQFTDRSTNNPTSWLWDFGDGGSSTLQNPSHKFTTSGTYTVSLTSSNANGSNMTFNIINVNSSTSGGDIIFNPNLTYGSVTDIDGNTYKTIQIGTQTWMAENLKTTKYNNGELIGTTSPATLNITNETNPKYQWSYDGNESNVITYGRLYTWYAVTDNRNVCPTGWHLPSMNEFHTLYIYINTDGWKLKETGNTHWAGASGNNESGFTALPGGGRGNGFSQIKYNGYWWTSSETSTTNATFFWLTSSDNFVLLNYDENKSLGSSVRCIKD